MVTVVAARTMRTLSTPVVLFRIDGSEVVFAVDDGGGGEVVFVDGIGRGIADWQLAPSYPTLHDEHVHEAVEPDGSGRRPDAAREPQEVGRSDT